MQLKFSHGAKLHTIEYGKVRNDVSDIAHQYLNHTLVFDDEGITVGDIYDLMAKDPILASIYHRNFSKEFIEYIASIPEKKRRALYEKQCKKPNAIEYVELKRFYEYDAVNQLFVANACGILNVSAMSRVLARGYDGYKKGNRISYSMTGLDVGMLYHMPVKYNKLAVATQENNDSNRPVNRKEYSQVKEFIVPEITLNELIEAVTWELSFYGSPGNAQEKVKELTGLVKESKAEHATNQEANRILKEVVALKENGNEDVQEVIFSISLDKENIQETVNKLIEMGVISISNSFAGTPDYEMLKRFIANALEQIVEGKESFDVDYLLALAQESADKKQKEIKRFEYTVNLVQAKLATDTPVDEAHAERNQIVVNKIVETAEKIKNNDIVQKELAFINKELEDVIVDIEKGIVTEVFIHIDRINKDLNAGFENRYKEKLYGFSKLPESIDGEKKKKLAHLIEVLPNDVLMSDFVEVLFQNTAILKDEVKDFNAYEYRVNSKTVQSGSLFNVHDNKALEKKMALASETYNKKYIAEQAQTEEAKRIISEGKSMFLEDVAVEMKNIHKLVTEIRPDVSLLRWKEITPKKPKLSKVKTSK